MTVSERLARVPTARPLRHDFLVFPS